MEERRPTENNLENIKEQEVVDDALVFLHQTKRNSSLSWNRSFSTDSKFDMNQPGPVAAGPSLSALMEFLQLGKVTHEFEHSLFGAATCTACKASLLFLQYYLDRHSRLDEVAADAKLLCRGLASTVGSPAICTGLVDMFAEEVFTVLQRTHLPPQQICGFMFGEACGNPANPEHEWRPMVPPAPRRRLRHPRPGRAAPLTILHLSDTHWDPQYSAGSLAACPGFLCCRQDSGRVEDASQAAGYWGDFRKCDTPWRTIEAMYSHIAAAHPEVDIIYWTGDLPAHDIWNQSRAGNSGVVRATAQQLVSHFPGLPVLPALGNHESVPVDSFPPPSVELAGISMAWLYDTLAEAWAGWLGPAHAWSVRKGAFYSLNPAPGLRVISLNMNYCMNKNMWLLLNSTDPADQLQWLVYELQLAEFKGEKVHILGHIPPGHVDCVRVWSRNFNQIVARYSDTITAQFYGHTHQDEFQLFFSEAEPPTATGIAYIAPSVTPYHGLNPSYRLYTVDGAGTVVDHQTWIMDLKAANLAGPGRQPSWSRLYSARAAYQLADLSPPAWHDLVSRLQRQPAAWTQFYHFYHSGVREQPPCDPACRHRILCSLVTSASHQDSKSCRGLLSQSSSPAWWWLG